MTPEDTLTVFVIDDDGCAGGDPGHVEVGGIAFRDLRNSEEFLRSKRRDGPSLPDSGREATWSQRSGFSARTEHTQASGFLSFSSPVTEIFR